jgi:hypothetical protein
MLADDERTSRSRDGLWAEVEREILRLTLDAADPDEVRERLEEVTRRHLGRAWPAEGELDTVDLGLAPGERARLARAHALVDTARRLRLDPQLRDLRHDLSSALTAVLATLDLLIASLEDGSAGSAADVAESASFAREAATRMMDAFNKWPR